MSDPLDETLEQEKTFEDYRREALEEQRKASVKAAPPTMAEFARAEREKLLPKIQRTSLILDQAAAYGYGIEQRRR